MFNLSFALFSVISKLHNSSMFESFVQPSLALLVNFNKKLYLRKDSINGNYSVKNGYKVLMNTNRMDDMSVQHGDWLSLWKIQAPPKAKHLICVVIFRVFQK
jgi:hypothetical protein